MQKKLVKYRKDYMPSSHLIDSIDLTIDIREEETYVTAKMQVRTNPQFENGGELILNGENQKLQYVKLNNKKLAASEYTPGKDSLTLKHLPEKFSLEIQSIIKPQDNTQLMGLYKSNDMFCTQCEPEGFRRIIYFLDRPDVLSCYTTTIIADKKRYPVLLSNGNLIESKDLDKDRHLAKWKDPFKKPCYLFAMVAGDLDYIEDYFTTASNRKITLRIFSEKGNQEKCKFAMSSLKKAMRWDEEKYGREYDLDIFMIVAVSDFNSGAMENKGLNIFNTKYILANPDTATDKDYENIDRVIAHEYFHNWTGDRITCQDWFQLSLKEGLTVFRDQAFLEDVSSAAVTRINEVQHLRDLQFSEDAGPLAHSVRPDSYIKIDNFYTMTIYEKGAEVIRMMSIILGKENFRKGMDLYFERFDGQAVTCDDFVKAMEDASNIDLTQFKLWYNQAGTPELNVTSEYDVEKEKYYLTVEQVVPKTPGQDKKLPMHIPLAVGVNEKSLVLHVTKTKQTFIFDDVKRQPVPSLLRGFSAPVKLHYDYSSQELAYLMINDTDSFARWEAGQIYASKIILEMVGQSIALPDQFVDAFHKTLNNKKLDKALIALMLSLPTECYLAELVDVVDPGAIHMARENMQRALALHFKDDFLRLYKSNKDNKTYSYNVTDAAKRSLKNICLHYLMQLNDNSIYEMCMQQFANANNMTDRMTALVEITNSDSLQRTQVLDEFYQKYQNDSLVIDKWFAVQAMSKSPDALHEVKKLLQHPAFTLKNPNRARSLLYYFANINPVRFHDVSGEGYVLLTDQILKMDVINPKIAARLVKPLTKWQRYDEARQKLMQEQLERMLQHKKLSKDVYEIVCKGGLCASCVC